MANLSFLFAFVVSYVLFSNAYCAVASNVTVLHALYDWLLSDYQPRIRPVFDAARSTRVTYDSDLAQIIEAVRTFHKRQSYGQIW